MGTPANITVRDKDRFVCIFRHYDGYPNRDSGVLELIRRALQHSWVLPRFEADCFAAALVCEIQAQSPPGSARIGAAGLVASGVPEPPYDSAYNYTITSDGYQLRVMIEDLSDVKQFSLITIEGVSGGYVAPED